MGMLKKKILMSDLIDRDFVPSTITPAPIEEAAIPATKKAGGN